MYRSVFLFVVECSISREIVMKSHMWRKLVANRNRVNEDQNWSSSFQPEVKCFDRDRKLPTSRSPEQD